MTEENQQAKHENVSYEQAEAACKQAAADADEREDIAIDWGRLEDDPVQKLDEDAFAKHVGDTFEIDHDGRKVTVKLAEVVHLGDTVDLGEGSPGAQSQFAAVFEGTGDALPEEGIHTVRHDGLGEIYLHLQHVEPENGGAPRLVAVFS